MSARNCIYCRTKLIRFPSRQAISARRRLIFQLSLCACCGWWSVYRVHQGEHPETPEFECYAGVIGCLKELDLTDISIPLDEVRSYLAAKSDRLTQIHPKRFEDLVCSVFSDLGWHARVTAYSGDGGIDVILDGPSKKPIGVQVKRSGKHRRVEAEQIRALAGAMLVNGMTKGIFVTTSSFRRGARTTAAQLGSIGYPVELLDATAFLRALGIAQLKSFRVNRGRITSHLLSKGVHLGSGPARPFDPHENLLKRQPVTTIWTRDEFIERESLPASQSH